MIRVQLTNNLTNYYFATEDIEYNDSLGVKRFWQARVVNNIPLQRFFPQNDTLSQRLRTLTVVLDNSDGFFNALNNGIVSLLNNDITVYYHEGDSDPIRFTGRILEIPNFGRRVELTVSEVVRPNFNYNIPDAQVSFDGFPQVGPIDNWNAIPMIFGICKRIKCVQVDYVNMRYLIGSGQLYSVDKIYLGDPGGLRSTYTELDLANGYQATPESTVIKARIFKGKGYEGAEESIGGVTSVYPGLAYIEFHDGAGNPIEPRMKDGNLPEIFVDVHGMVDNDTTPTEAVRNPASIIYKILTNPTTPMTIAGQSQGNSAWGLGIAVDKVDCTQAILDCASLSFKMDGIIDRKDSALQWLNELLKSCRGYFQDVNGVLTLKIDAAPSTDYVDFDEAGELGYNINLDSYREPALDKQINRLKIMYDIDYVTGKYNKQPVPEDIHTVDSTHATMVSKYNLEQLEFPMIKDDTTAYKLGQYYLKKMTKSRVVIQFTTEKAVGTTNFTIGGVTRKLDQGDLIRVQSSKFGWILKVFRITDIIRKMENTVISAVEYDSSIFTYTAATGPGDMVYNTGGIYDIPAKPTTLSLSFTDNTFRDGTRELILNISAYKPNDPKVDRILFYYKGPGDTEFKFLANAQNDETTRLCTARISWSNRPIGNYYFRAVSISAIGIYSSLAITGGDTHYYGQPGAEAAYDVAFDTTACDEVTSLVVTPGINSNLITWSFDQGNNRDFARFIIEYSTNGASWNVLNSNHTSNVYIDDYGSQPTYTARYYRVKTVDTVGNVSLNPATTGSAYTPNQVQTGDITNNPIIGKCFQTNNTVGIGNPGVIFDCNGIRGYSCTAETFNLCASTGNAYFYGTVCASAGNIGGFCADPTEGFYAGTGITRVQMKPGSGFWAGATAQIDAPFSVTSSGAIKATSGTVGGWTLGASALSSGSPGSFSYSELRDSGATFASSSGQSCLCLYAFTGPTSLHVCGGYVVGMPTLYLNADTVICAYKPIQALQYIAAGACLVTGSYVTTSLGTGNYLCLSGHASGYTGGGAHIWLQNNAAKAYINYNETGSVIYLRGRVIACCCLSAGTVVWANGNSDPYAGGLSLWDGVPDYYGIAMRYNQVPAFGWTGASEFHIINYLYAGGSNRGWVFYDSDGGAVRASIRAWDGAAMFGYVGACNYIQTGAGAYIGGKDFYAEKQVRAAGWYSGPWAGHAAEIGVSGGEGYVISYDRTASAYCKINIGGICVNIYAGTGCEVRLTAGSGGIYVCHARNHIYDASIYNTLSFVNGFPSTTLGSGALQATQLAIRSAATNVVDMVFQDCTGTRRGHVYWDANGFGLLDGGGSWALWTTTTYICAYNHNLQSNCRIESVSTYGTIALNGTLPGYGAMCYPTLCSSTAIYLSACGYFTGYFENQALCIFGNIKTSACVVATSCMVAAAFCVSSSRSTKYDMMPVPKGLILEGIRKLPFEAYRRYSDCNGKLTFGTYAEDFRCVFPWLGDGKYLPMLDQIAVRGIQELDSCFASQQACILSLESRLAAIEEKLNADT